MEGYLSAEKSGLTFFIKKSEDGVFLYSIPESGFFSDTWHQRLEDAKSQAEYEANSTIKDWRLVPAEQGDQFISEKLKAFNSK